MGSLLAVDLLDMNRVARWPRFLKQSSLRLPRKPSFGWLLAWWSTVSDGVWQQTRCVNHATVFFDGKNLAHLERHASQLLAPVVAHAFFSADLPCSQLDCDVWCAFVTHQTSEMDFTDFEELVHFLYAFLIVQLPSLTSISDHIHWLRPCKLEVARSLIRTAFFFFCLKGWSHIIWLDESRQYTSSSWRSVSGLIALEENCIFLCKFNYLHTKNPFVGWSFKLMASSIRPD